MTDQEKMTDREKIELLRTAVIESRKTLMFGEKTDEQLLEIIEANAGLTGHYAVMTTCYAKLQMLTRVALLNTGGMP